MANDGGYGSGSGASGAITPSSVNSPGTITANNFVASAIAFNEFQVYTGFYMGINGSPLAMYFRADTTGGFMFTNPLANDLFFIRANGFTTRFGGQYRIAADITNATITFANLTGLSVPALEAGRTYKGKLILYVSDSTAVDGCKFDFNGGSATITDFRAMGRIADTVSVRPMAMVTSIATAMTDATTTGSSIVEIDFTVTVNLAGTFIPRFAQNAHSTGTLTAFRGGVLLMDDIV